MLVSAEVRWFWRNECPRQIHDWFFRSGLPPVGGRPKIDRYIQQPNNAELGIKERGDIAGLEIKGLVATRTSPALAKLASHLEIWCKWSCVVPDLSLTAAVTLRKHDGFGNLTRLRPFAWKFHSMQMKSRNPTMRCIP
jgi:hypothetical protein